MSRHTFKTFHLGRPVEVVAGWDRPLQGFFLMVLYTDDTEGMDYAYNNLDNMNPNPDAFDDYAHLLADMGITLPDAMVTDIKLDGKDNMGNKYHDWSGRDWS